MPDRKQQPWTDEEDAFLRCPVPAAYLAAGALRGRSPEAIRWRRRVRDLRMTILLGQVFVGLKPKKPANRRYELSDFPDVDWNQQLNDLQEQLGNGQRSVWRLRKEAIEAGLAGPSPKKPGAKPFRDGRRGYRAIDFPHVDWEASTPEIMKLTGLCRTTVYRLRRDAMKAKKRHH